jgi:hypothetical protein
MNAEAISAKAPSDISGSKGLMDDVKFHFCNALVDNSNPFSSGIRHINFSSSHKRAAVIDPDCHRTPIGDVCHAQSRAKWQRRMSSGQFIGIEFFPTRSFGTLGIKAR